MLKKDENNTGTGKIAVVGDKDSVLAFKAIGLEVHAVESADEAATVLKKLARDCAVIFITEQIAEKVSDVIQRYKARPYPAVIPIPGWWHRRAGGAGHRRWLRREPPCTVPYG